MASEVRLTTDISDHAKPRPSEHARLMVVCSDRVTERALGTGETLIVGRGEDAGARIDHPSVSRRHAALTVTDVVRIEDLGSANGTWVGGARLEPNASATVRFGTAIELGGVIVIVRGPHDPKIRPRGPGLVVCDPAMERVHALLDLVAKSRLTVLLQGETGVGKEVAASRIHGGSPRAARSFVKLNCAALVESILESELFGHERGAFTGAGQTKEGLLEVASGGTMFLDEVGDLPLTTQAKLLRVLENAEVTRVGGLKPRAIDVRFVAATNKDLHALVANGAFREDLYFRLDGVSVYIPPLRERPSEIPGLVLGFVRAACAANERPLLRVSSNAMGLLLGHGWPGNVRELRNVMQRAVVLCEGAAIEPIDLRFATITLRPPSERPPSAPDPVAPGAPLDERERIMRALTDSGGNQTRAAKVLGFSRRTLLKRLDGLDLPRPRKNES